jgi:hypothetical protein
MIVRKGLDTRPVCGSGRVPKLYVGLLRGTVSGGQIQQIQRPFRLGCLYLCMFLCVWCENEESLVRHLSLNLVLQLSEWCRTTETERGQKKGGL